MRRYSDTNDGGRTGRGRRARDRLLRGEPPQASASSSELSNLLYFVGDDLREAAMAVGGIEAFLVAVEELLADPAVSAAAVGELDSYAQVNERIERLGDSMDSLCRSLYRLRRALDRQPDAADQTPAASSTA